MEPAAGDVAERIPLGLLVFLLLVGSFPRLVVFRFNFHLDGSGRDGGRKGDQRSREEQVRLFRPFRVPAKQSLPVGGEQVFLVVRERDAANLAAMKRRKFLPKLIDDRYISQTLYSAFV